MFRLLHFVILITYFLAPPAALAMAIWFHRAGRRGSLRSLSVTTICAASVGACIVMIYVTVSAGRVSILQLIYAAYFALAMLLILRAFDFLLQVGLRKLLRLDARKNGDVSSFRDANANAGENGHVPRCSLRVLERAARILVFAALRVCILFGVGLPYLMAVLMVYRPRVMPAVDPQSRLGLSFDRVEFKAQDGTRLVGWWIPAQSDRMRHNDLLWGQRTVVMCPGVAGSKSSQLSMIRFLPASGFNVLALDPRGTGESSGQLSSFGELERLDVLAAVQWIRANHAKDSLHVSGVGDSTGAAALIGAAADRSPEGQAIESIAAYGCFDRFDAVARDLCTGYFAPPLDWLLMHVAIPIASAHVGVDLDHFAPADIVQDFWPRPILFIHCERDEVIDYLRGQSLFDAASPPRYYLWFPQGSHADLLTNPAAARIVPEFFRAAQPLPVI